MSKKWEKEECDLLKENYQLCKKELLKLFPNRTSHAINIQSHKMKLRKEKNEYCQSDTSILLLDNYISYYWIGFILADGHISQLYRLYLTLSVKDTEHLKKINEYIKINNTIRICKKPTGDTIGFTCQDKFWISKIVQKFDIHHNKTYNPPKYIPEDNFLFLSMLIGFIDGDGYIRYQYKRKDCLSVIKLHSSWLPWLKLVKNKLHSIGFKITQPRINNSGYAELHIIGTHILVYMKIFAIENKLPFLNRKWDIVDVKYISRYIKSFLMMQKVKHILIKNPNIKPKDIAKQLNAKVEYVYFILRKLRKTS